MPPAGQGGGDIKKDFEVNSTYLVFENSDVPKKSNEFEGIISVLGERNIEKKIFYDQAGGRFLLVVRIDPNEEKKITGELFNKGFPGDVPFSVYRSRSDKQELSETIT